ncbi:glucose-1-phosphate cytidylyltransferase [Desulfosarcina ovata subsp. sediminis]|uniref:Glucose-1-phosphate cytidylyltransferase n=1 Tax=Desulfosarcina ovata subsp. sediminis TaxID=885957 RepID=A0A5K7ZR56_9BACT|nr:glucose-1-phosphate cytidylyltransferase [Desulfosarcina ovata]BBO82790.1 glucose-1-phosphate cytidylyltransferase [Desulfosarcina ovata subsp. sediminis]
MKVVILAGGFGTRISEETAIKPKPMVEIGGKPILWHIMKLYSAFGLNDFIVCCGYKGYMIKEYFANYYLHSSDITFDMANQKTEIHQNNSEPWRVTLVDTGFNSGTGGRLRWVRPYIGDDDFCFTYGDGVSNVDIEKLIAFHNAKGKLATVTAILPSSKYGVLKFSNGDIHSFDEKPETGWINGGFFVLSPKVFDFIDSDETMWEHAPMKRLVQENQLSAYPHKGFWHCMDTLRDKQNLEKLWQSGKAPWKVWT